MGKTGRSIYALLEKDHKVTFLKIGSLYEALNRLRYEGKINFGRNIAEVGSLVSYFKKELAVHMREEEKVLFPFIRKHIPRLEPVVYLLLSEHQDFREGIRSMEKCLRSYRKKHALTPGRLGTLCDRGTYLTCLLRSHMWVESSSLYKAADNELSPLEKSKLIRDIKKREGK